MMAINMQERKKKLDQHSKHFLELARRRHAGQDVADSEATTLPDRYRNVLQQLKKASGQDDFLTIWDTLTRAGCGFLDPLREAVQLPPDEAEPVKERSYQLRPLSYFKNRPRKVWGIEKMLFNRGTSLFVGDGGSGKSALVLNAYLSRVCNILFAGMEVSPAFLIWVAAESEDEVYPRAAAFFAHHNIPEETVTNFLILEGRVPFNNAAEVSLFIEETREQLDELNLPPETEFAFVFDTYARCTPGADENSTQETKLIADSVLKISTEFSAHVSVIHHMNKEGRIRGNTALRDAVDTLWEVTKDGSKIRLHCNKMRGTIEPDDVYVEMRSIVLDENDLDYTAPVICATDAELGGPITPRVQMQMLEILYSHGQLSCNTWQKHCQEVHGISNGAFHSHLRQLKESELVNKPEGKDRGKRFTYSLTEKGADLLA